ncbi:hypothetical protein yc1106_01319 [Curvularia clavata]|uniref:Ribonuclease H2 subunit B n=1 Tax=Curvularia clavata TaxID=95742 RepID=A0A9Q8Z2N2_CURCL|nr:hypothetical protein yc1106_01319 [Curvularia clavata]
MARTRSKPAKATPTESTPEPTTTQKSLPASASNPPKLFVLPKDASQNARIVTLDNPANDTSSRYFFCPEKGFYEFTRIAAPKRDCRSWLITGSPSEDEHAREGEKEDADDSRIGSGYVNKSADLFVATPIDLLFLILPALAPKTAKDTKQHFLAFDDYLEMLSTSSPHWKALLSQCLSLKDMLEKRIRIICDTVDAGEETMYRISLSKLRDVLVAKAERMVKRGLPASMEEKFVKSALEVPVMNIRREESTISAVSNTDGETVETKEETTTISTTVQESEDSPAQALSTPPEIPHLLRIRTSITYLTSSYMTPTLSALLTPLLTSLFAPLTTHLAAIASLKAEAAALRSITDNVSRKRAALEDDDKMAEREEKKRKKEEEDRKKKLEGRAIKQLKKVDTSGMRKMSSFFTKVDKTKK